MLKIAMITPQWLQTKGGPSNYVKNLKENMETRGHTVAILTCENGPDVFHFSQKPIMRDLQIIKILKQLRPDIIHIHGRLHLIMPAVLYKKRVNKKTKIIFTFHTQPRYMSYLNGTETIHVPYTGIKGKIGSFLLEYCDEITSVSDSLIRNINSYCDMSIKRYTVIQAGANEQAISKEKCEEFSKRYKLEEAFPVMSSIGVFSWDWKVAGHKISIETVGILKEKYPRIRLLIAGDGPYRGFLEDVAKTLGVERNIEFCGSMDDPSVILHLSDIYVHMALNESLGLAIIEAMMAKKTIVAANRGGIPEILNDGKTGFLIEPSAQKLADKILELLNDRERLTVIGMNAFDYASSHLSWQKIGGEYLALYEKGEYRA